MAAKHLAKTLPTHPFNSTRKTAQKKAKNTTNIVKH
jgi:hypothetical protein